jgi:hypothetical protein
MLRAGRVVAGLYCGGLGGAEAALGGRGVHFVAADVHLAGEVVGSGHAAVGVEGGLHAFFLDGFLDDVLEAHTELW